MKKLAKILSVGTAVPPYALDQNDIRQLTAVMFREHFSDIDRLLAVFGNSCIKKRHLSRPLAWYAAEHSFAEANQIFADVALDLSVSAARQALDKAGIPASAVGAVLFISSTGITTPTLDTKLIQKLQLSPHTVRVPVWGLGCAGGAAGVARAAQLVDSLPDNKTVLMVAVELCSLTFQRNDYSKANLVGTSIFADGAAAVVLAADGDGPSVCGWSSTLLPNTEDIMGWDLVDTGLKVRFSRDIPALIHQFIPSLVEEACADWGLQQNQLRHLVFHPGGAKVLKAYSESLLIPEQRLALSYEVLSDYGNMSSAAILFVLEKFLPATKATGDWGLMLSMGPGFCAEQVLFQW